MSDDLGFDCDCKCHFEVSRASLEAADCVVCGPRHRWAILDGIKRSLIEDQNLLAHLQHAIEALLGEPLTEHFRDTPKRIAEMWRSFQPQPFEFTTFENPGFNQMITLSDVYFASMCAHHFMPFFGTAKVAYIPASRLAGVSKLARAVDFAARNFTTQEDVTQQIAQILDTELRPTGVAVQLDGTHTCMIARGVMKPGATMRTTALKGVFLDGSERGIAARAEFTS